jgi:hypothetical protein
MVSGVAVKKLDELAANEHVKGGRRAHQLAGRLGDRERSDPPRRSSAPARRRSPSCFSMGELGRVGRLLDHDDRPRSFAETATITGSIGVFGMRFQPGARMRRTRVHSEIVCTSTTGR